MVAKAPTISVPPTMPTNDKFDGAPKRVEGSKRSEDGNDVP